jgi:hypothetical protein
LTASGLRTRISEHLRLDSSLARQARRQQAHLRGRESLRGLAVRAGAGIAALFTRPSTSLVALSIIGVAGLFLPSELPLYWWSPKLNLFSLEGDAERFITALWQVQGAVLALSIAVIVFAFQAVPSSRYGIKLYEFAEDTRLFPVFNWGIVGLLVDGLVLLGCGRGAPAGSAGSWAVVVSMSSFVTVA